MIRFLAGLAVTLWAAAAVAQTPPRVIGFRASQVMKARVDRALSR